MGAAPAATPPSNPMWDKIKKMIGEGYLAYQEPYPLDNGSYGYRSIAAMPYGNQPLRDLKARYSLVALPHPDLVEWLDKRVGPAVVEADARNGYWSWLLAGMPERPEDRPNGRKVFAYDLAPPPPPRSFIRPIGKLDDKRTSVAGHHGASLLMVAPDLRHAAITLKAYPGDDFLIVTTNPDTSDKFSGELVRGRWTLKEWFIPLYYAGEPMSVYHYVRMGDTTWGDMVTRLMPRVPISGLRPRGD